MLKIQTDRINYLLGTNYISDTHMYGIGVTLFEATEWEDFEDFGEVGLPGTYYEDTDGFDYLKVYNKDGDVIILAMDCETNKLSLF